MNKILMIVCLLLTLQFVPNVHAGTTTCTVHLDDPITFTHTRVEKTYTPVQCSNIPAGSTITDVFHNWLVCNITASGTIEVGLENASNEFSNSFTQGNVPQSPICGGIGSHSSVFNGMPADTVFTLTGIFSDMSTSSGGFPLPPTGLAHFNPLLHKS